MEVYNTVQSLLKRRSSIPQENSIGLVPTMGALHKGHLSLVTKAKNENDLVVATIFVNPTQFDRKEDLDNYPSSLEDDLKMLEEVGCDIAFVPVAKEIYADTIESEKFDFDGLDLMMEGQFRKGHFDGVATIVKKLFIITKPSRAYFGKKDFQQLQIIKKMVDAENLPVEIVPCEIFREDDGLAMSSRNRRLEPKRRAEAPLIFKTLQNSKVMLEAGESFEQIHQMALKEFSESAYLDLEYFEIAEKDTLRKENAFDATKKYIAFVAAYAGDIRLIDNIELN